MLFQTNVKADVIPVGAGAYTTTLPSGVNVPSNQNNQAVSPSTVTGFSKPVVANKWWSSLIWKYFPGNNFSQNLFSYPLASQATARGLELGYANQYYATGYTQQPGGWKSQEYHYTYVHDIIVNVNGMNATNVQVADYSDWSVTANWSNNNRSLQAVITSGSPFVYFTPQGDNVVLTFAGTPTIWSNNNGVLGITVGDRHYGVFAPSGSTWSGTTTLQSSLSGKNYLSVASLPDNTATTLEFYRKHAYAFITNTAVNWTYDEANSVVNTTFNIQTTLKESGNGNLNTTLISLLRHQWLYCTNPLTNYTYTSPRGTLKVFEGNQFITKQTFNGILPSLPLFAKDGVDGYSQAQLYSYVDQVFKQSSTARWNGIATSADTYWYGKAFGKIAQLIKIADQVGHTQARDLFIQETKTRLQNWFRGTGSTLFYYSQTWDTIIGYPASYGSDNNLNDHHFHYGYFIQAAATVAQYDQSWIADANYGGIVKMLIKDVSNWDRNDSQFPFLHYYDVYAGHGWASGPALFASGNNQESSSESINYSSALVMLGGLTNNKTIRDLGIYLYTTEINAIREYWFDVDDQVFPKEFTEPTLGILWGDGGAYANFWGGTVNEVHGINFLPITAASLYLGQYPSYLAKNYAFMQNNGLSLSTWLDIILSMQVLYDSKTALNTFASNINYNPETGESKAHTYHWLHNLNQLGQVNTTITANSPHYAVFTKNGTINRVAFNPTNATRNVTFSDGVTLSVPAFSYRTTGQGGATPPPPPAPPPSSPPPPPPASPPPPPPHLLQTHHQRHHLQQLLRLPATFLFCKM